MAATGVRILFFGSHKQPSYVVEKFMIPREHDLQNGEILTKILMTTVCDVDLDHIDGKRKVTTPCVLGHEGVGEVIASKRSAFSIGDRVAFSVANQCGCCCICEEEVKEFCVAKEKRHTGSAIKKNNLYGTFSTNMILKPDSHVVHIPPNVSNVIACPANCVLATMVHALTFLETSSHRKHSVAIIQGANLMGLYGCALLKESGFESVYCQDTTFTKLSLVSQFGGIPILVSKENGFDGEKQSSYPNCDTVDVVINVCNEWDGISFGLNMLQHQGIYLFVGFTHDYRPHDLSVDTILKKGLTVKGIRGYGPEHLEKAVQFLSKTVNKYPYEQLCSPVHSLEDFHIAVEHSRTGIYYRVPITPTP